MVGTLAFYAELCYSQRLAFCFDETATQLLPDARPTLPVELGKPRPEDYEYRRKGILYLFLACEPWPGGSIWK